MLQICITVIWLLVIWDIARCYTIITWRELLRFCVVKFIILKVKIKFKTWRCKTKKCLPRVLNAPIVSLDHDNLNCNMCNQLTYTYVEMTWWRHQMETFFTLLALCTGIHLSPVNSPHKDQWRRALMFSLICALTNGCVNNRDAGDLRRHRAHYDVTVMKCTLHWLLPTTTLSKKWYLYDAAINRLAKSITSIWR